MLSGSRLSRRLCSRCLGHLQPTAVRPAFVSARFQSSASPNPENEHISSTLLQRARAIATEHKTLSVANAENYSIAAAKKLGELGPICETLKEWDQAHNSLNELHGLLEDPSSDAEIRSLAQQDIDETLASIPSLASQLKNSLIPAHPFASMPCFIEFHPGAGGSEASLFAQTLLDMYRQFCGRMGWPTTLAAYQSDGAEGEAGLSEAMLEVNHPGSYDILRTEAGVHRVQRVPATEKKGRTHTSAVSILVLPTLPAPGADSDLNYEDPNSDYYVSITEVRSETMRARGAGGQHVNKTDSAVRLTHIPTGIVVAMQESRSQHKNREKAWAVLRSKLAQKRREEREAKVIAVRREVMGGVNRSGREDKIRTYNFSQNRVTDHRSMRETLDLDGVLAGGNALEDIMDGVREWMGENEIKGVLAEEELKRREVEKEKQEEKIKG